MAKRSFLEQFLHSCGETEVPRSFYLWSGISLVSACLGDRVWYEKFKGQKLLPNLYVFLIGPSGLGKGVAIDAVLNLLKDDFEPYIKRMNVIRGKVTAQALIDFLAKQGYETVADEQTGRSTRQPTSEPVKLFFVAPELSFSIGSGPLADTMVKMLTDWSQTMQMMYFEGTRMHGEKRLFAPVINWLAGTTKEWLVESISKDAIQGGFFGRVVSVAEDYDYTKRIHTPQYPQNYAETVAWLERRVRWMARVSGRVRFSRQAKAVDEAWYYERAVPDDEAMLPTWKRAHDLVLKLAMIMMIDTRPKRLLVKAEHVVAAQKLLLSVQRVVPELITISSTTPENEAIMYVRRVIQSRDRIDWSSLVRYGAKRGLAKDKTRQALDTLVEGHEVVVDKENGKEFYYTAGKRRKQHVTVRMASSVQTRNTD